MVSLVDIAAGGVFNVDFIHPHGSRKTFNYHQCSDSCYVPVKNIIQKISTPPTTSTGELQDKLQGLQNTVPEFSRIQQ